MDDDLPRVTAGMLRRAETMCPRRLHHEHTSGRKLSALGDVGFEVSNRLHEEARLAHADPTVPLSRAFPDPTDLEHEQRALYLAAVRAYRAHFGDNLVQADDLPFETKLDDVGVRLVGPVGVAVRDEHGRPELRVLRIGASARLFDDVDMRFTVLRTAEWARDRLHLVVIDLLNEDSAEYELDIAAEHGDALDWLRGRVEVIRTRSNRRLALAGGDCGLCPCVPGCPELT